MYTCKALGESSHPQAFVFTFANTKADLGNEDDTHKAGQMRHTVHIAGWIESRQEVLKIQAQQRQPSLLADGYEDLQQEGDSELGNFGDLVGGVNIKRVRDQNKEKASGMGKEKTDNGHANFDRHLEANWLKQLEISKETGEVWT